MNAFFQNIPIRLKFILPVIAVLVLMLISVYLYFPMQHKRALVQANKREVTKTAELFSVAVAHALEQHNFELLKKTLQGARVDPNILFILLLDENEQEVVAYNPQKLPLCGLIIPDKTAIIGIEEIIIARQNVFSIDSAYLGKLLVGYSLSELNAQIRHYRIIIIVFSLLSFIVGLILIQQISKRIVNSISLLHSQMKEIIDKGNFGSNVQIYTRDEVGLLSNVFNRMVGELRTRQEYLAASENRYRSLNEKLTELNQQKSIFVSNASHVLRTSLAIIRGEIEVALRKRRSLKEYQEVLKIVEDETLNLGKIVENLLTLAKADAGKLLSVQEVLDFSALCKQRIKYATILFHNKNISLTFHIQKGCLVNGDGGRLAEMVTNLIENAVKYTPENHSIDIRLQNTEGGVCLKVADTGIGIPEDEINYIFNRFYRGKNSQRVSKGTGLGLAICESIIKAHGGEIHVISVPGKGSIFEVWLKPATVRADEIYTIG